MPILRELGLHHQHVDRDGGSGAPPWRQRRLGIADVAKIAGLEREAEVPAGESRAQDRLRRAPPRSALRSARSSRWTGSVGRVGRRSSTVLSSVGRYGAPLCHGRAPKPCDGTRATSSRAARDPGCRGLATVLPVEPNKIMVHNPPAMLIVREGERVRGGGQPKVDPSLSGGWHTHLGVSISFNSGGEFEEDYDVSGCRDVCVLDGQRVCSQAHGRREGRT